MTTYTIAYDQSSGLLYATVPDGQDVMKAVEAELTSIGEGEYIPDLQIESGLHLTDDVTDTDTVIFAGGSSNGWLEDETGELGLFAIR